MNERIKATPKEFFLNLAVFAMLYVVAYDFVLLVFNCIDYFLADHLYRGYVNAFSIRMEVALLLVTFPGFLLVSRAIGTIYASEPAQEKARSRQWLLYLTLFITAATLLVIVVAVIFSFLNGDLTASMALKALTLFLVAGSIFEYHRQFGCNSNVGFTAALKKLTLVATSIVFLAVCTGIYITGSPYYERRVRMDQQRLGDLQTIEMAIKNYWKDTKQLPENLEQLYYSDLRSVDFESVKKYEYKVLGPDEFTLCAEFQTNNKQDVARFGESKWAHDAGKTCFERSVK